MKRSCEACGAEFAPGKPNARFCSAACRARGYRAARKAAAAPPAELDEGLEADGLVASVRRDLAAAGRLETTYGQLALVLARQSTKADATGVQGLSKELTRVLALALDGVEAPKDEVPAVQDEVDEARRRRDAKLGTAAARTS